MHHAKEAHHFDKPPSHAFALPREGKLTELLLKEFPEAHFNEEFQEWRIDWDEKAFPHQGQRLDAFATTHELEIFHRY